MSGSYHGAQFTDVTMVTDKLTADDGIQYIQLIGAADDHESPTATSDVNQASSQEQDHSASIEGHIFHVEDDEPMNLSQQHLVTSNGLNLPFNQSIIVSNMGQQVTQPGTVDISNIASLVNGSAGQALQLPISQPASVGESLISVKQEAASSQGFQGPDGQIFYVKQDNVNGQIVTSVVDPTNKPVALPPGTQMISLPQMPASNSILSDGEQPLYVNPKQYNRILKRRMARAKLEAEGKIPKFRAKYIHESRHKHAQRRVRGPGGKFLSKPKTSPEAQVLNFNTSTPSHTPSKKDKENLASLGMSITSDTAPLAFIDMDQLSKMHVVTKQEKFH